MAGVVLDELIEDSVERDLLARAKICIWTIMLLFGFIVMVLFHLTSQVDSKCCYALCAMVSLE